MRSARLWNIVGFQTKLKHGEQTRLFRTIPGLQSAEFARLGGLHRNTFLNSPRLLDATLAAEGDAAAALRRPDHRLRRLCRKRRRRADDRPVRRRRAAGRAPSAPPATTAMGALLGHITGGADAATFQPMNVNFGLFPPIDGAFRGKERKQALSARALRDFDLACADAARRGVIPPLSCLHLPPPSYGGGARRAGGKPRSRSLQFQI